MGGLCGLSTVVTPAGASINVSKDIFSRKQYKGDDDDPVALDGTDPPIETSVRRCGGAHYRGLDISDLCPPYAHLPHGNASLSSGPSSISVSFLDSPDDHDHTGPADRNDAGQETNTLLPCPVQIGVCPQSRPTFTLQTAVVRVAQGRTVIAPAVVIPPHFLDLENAFPEEIRRAPHTHHGQAAQRPHHEYIIPMPLLT